jgi:hypothetical protein
MMKLDTTKMRTAILAAADAGLEAAGDVIANRAVTSMGTNHGGVPSAPLGPPNSQSGTLHKSIMRTKAINHVVKVGTAVKYGRYLEFGAVVTPKKAERLAIPLNAEARMLSRRVAGSGGLRSLNLKSIKTRNGNILLGREKWSGRGASKSRSFEALFVLKFIAIILPRPWLRPALAQSRPQALAAFRAAFSRSFMRSGAM